MDYTEIFTRILREAPEVDYDASARDDANALRQTLSPDELDGYSVDEPPSSDMETARAIKEKALHWASQLDSFVAWINGAETNSLMKQVQQAQRNPGFEGIGDQTQREIVKAAAGLASLIQKINGFINTADTKIAKTLDGK